MSGQIETPADAGLLNAPVGQIAASRAGAASVFQTFGIDFCCQGKRTLAEALAGQGIAPSPVLAALMGAAAEPLDDWRDAPTPALIEHIKTRYHAVHLAELPNLRDLAAKVEATHRKHPDAPAGLAETLSRLLAEMRLHQQREEVVLFPLLAQGGGDMARSAIQVMRAEHDDHGAALARIEAITGGRVAPVEACASWRALYLGLGKFHDDLTMHVHLENNILFPRFEAAEDLKMTIRYQDAITDDRLDEAARRLLEIRAWETDVAISELAIRIVRDVFCFCVADEPDATSGRLASIHEAVAAEIIARAARIDALTGSDTAADRRIDAASRDSFPASNPPAWIYSH